MKFEYFVFRSSAADYDVEELLDQSGQHGWELVNAIKDNLETVFYMKKMVPTVGLEPKHE